MTTMKIIFILKRMDKMIRSQATGKPEEFASRLGVSERTMYNYLALLKGLGAPIQFSRVCDSYLYLEDCKLLMEYDKMLAG
jgi:predicted DNA-binding transcriptional regulator YafY